MERLRKVIANSGYCSRRKAEELIKQKKVVVNGKIISEFLASDLKHASRKFYSLDFNSESGKAKFIKEYVNIPSIILYNEKELNVYISTEDEDLNKLIALLSECDVKEFSNKRESLEEYFMKFYKEDKDFGGAL